MEQRGKGGRVRNIVEFYHRWPELKPCAVALRDSAALGGHEREVLGWMIELIDRVGPADLEP